SGVVVQAEGKLVAGGAGFSAFLQSMKLARYNPDGSLDNSFDTDGRVTASIGFSSTAAYGMALQGDGKIVLAGAANNNFAVMRFENDQLQLDPPAIIAAEGSTAVVTVKRVGGQTGEVSALL